jgi:hypothetical protein
MTAAPTSRGNGRHTGLRWAVRAVLALGVATSVAANILHATPGPISQAIAAWPPIALLFTVELTSRIPVHRRALGATRIAATVTIAGIAAWVSYRHMAAAAARYGESGTAAHLLPLSVDGLIVVASICLVELGERTATPATPAVPDEPAAAVPDTARRAAPAGHAPATTGRGPARRASTLAGRAAAPRAAAPAHRPPRRTVADNTVRVYEPSSNDDGLMYQRWRDGLAAGREPSGADLARAAGRGDDATGVGRRAVRRYRRAHATTDPPVDTPQPMAETEIGATRHNGHHRV